MTEMYEVPGFRLRELRDENERLHRAIVEFSAQGTTLVGLIRYAIELLDDDTTTRATLVIIDELATRIERLAAERETR